MGAWEQLTFWIFFVKSIISRLETDYTGPCRPRTEILCTTLRPLETFTFYVCAY